MQHIRCFQTHIEILGLRNGFLSRLLIDVIQLTVLVTVNLHLVWHERVECYDISLAVSYDLCISVTPQEQVRHKCFPEDERAHLRIRLIVEQVV